MEKCVETACRKRGLQVSALYQLSAPYLAHHLRGNLAGLEASVLSLTLLRGEGVDPNVSLVSQVYPAFEGKGIGRISVQYLMQML